MALEGASGHQGNIAALTGVRLQGWLNAKLSAELDLGWRHIFGRIRPDARMLFPADPARTSFTVFGTELARDEAVLAAGINYVATSRVTLRAGYNGMLESQSLSHTLS